MDTRILRYLFHQMSADELRLFEADYKRDPELAADTRRMKNLQALFTLHSSQKDEEGGKRSLQQSSFGSEENGVQKKIYALLRYAAVIVATAGLTLFIVSRVNRPQPSYASVSTQKGQVAQCTLPDGSKVWLNTDTRLIFNTLNGHRDVTVNGEALFDVRHDPAHPFIVKSKRGRIKVLGTKFMVTDFSREPYSVTLERGKVEVSSTIEGVRPIVLSQSQKAELIGTKFVVTKAKDGESSWTDGILTFTNVPLTHIAHIIERQYGTHIIISSSSLAQERYTAKFFITDGPMEILKMLRQSHEFDISSTPNGSIVLK